MNQDQSAELHRWLRRVGVADAFQALMDAVPVAVVGVDAEGRVRAWSAEAARRFGLAAEAVLGGPVPPAVAAQLAGAPGHGASGHRWEVPDAGALYVLGSGEAPASSAARELELPAGAVDFHGILSRDPAMLRVFQVVRNVAETDATVLVRGESGTGKELVVRAIHLESRRHAAPFVAVNCAAFSPSLLESELFGHVRGAFTGAIANRRGIFAQADGGTLFLDEVAELPMDLQAKLLRVIQERSFVPVGGSEPIKVDVRLVAGTHRALREEARAGRFREDLLYRLRVVPIFLPSLRERRADVELLFRHFVRVGNARGPRRVSRIAPEVMRAVLDHPWPGNVRELQNVVEYAFAVSRGEEITLEDLPPEFREGGRRATGTAATGFTEHERVARALDLANGDLSRAAELLGVSRTTFWRMRRRLGL